MTDLDLSVMREVARATIPPMPASIVKCICAIKSTVDAVEKSRRNEHGNFSYASTDDIYGAIARKMGDVGLAIIPFEMSIEFIDFTKKDGATQRWMTAVYQFLFATEDASWTHEKLCRTVMLPYTGATTPQAAESFASKAILRSTFKLPTGDADVEAMPETFDGPTFRGAVAPPPIPSAAPEKDDIGSNVAELRAINKVTEMFLNCRTRAELEMRWSASAEARAVLSEAAAEAAVNVYNVWYSKLED